MPNPFEPPPSDLPPLSTDAPSRDAGALPSWVRVHSQEAEARRAAAALKNGSGLAATVAVETGDVTLRTVKQAASQAQVSPRTIRRLIARGELPAVRIGRSVRIQPRDLEAFLASPSAW